MSIDQHALGEVVGQGFNGSKEVIHVLVERLTLLLQAVLAIDLPDFDEVHDVVEECGYLSLILDRSSHFHLLVEETALGYNQVEVLVQEEVADIAKTEWFHLLILTCLEQCCHASDEDLLLRISGQGDKVFGRKKLDIDVHEILKTVYLVKIRDLRYRSKICPVFWVELLSCPDLAFELHKLHGRLVIISVKDAHGLVDDTFVRHLQLGLTCDSEHFIDHNGSVFSRPVFTLIFRVQIEQVSKSVSVLATNKLHENFDSIAAQVSGIDMIEKAVAPYL